MLQLQVHNTEDGGPQGGHSPITLDWTCITQLLEALGEDLCNDIIQLPRPIRLLQGYETGQGVTSGATGC